MLWISIMPVVIILSVGTKLQGIICRMAIDITERHAVVQGIPLVQVSDSYFWFAKPTFVLFLIHFTLFQVRAVFHCSAFLCLHLQCAQSVSQSQVSSLIDCLSVSPYSACMLSVSAEWLPDHLFPLDSGTYPAISV